MKQHTNKIFWVLLVTAVYMACTGCELLPECPVCEECIEVVEDPYLCSKYYADKEKPEVRSYIGAFDFYLEEEE